MKERLERAGRHPLVVAFVGVGLLLLGFVSLLSEWARQP